jgi:hypothetical protein
MHRFWHSVANEPVGIGAKHEASPFYKQAESKALRASRVWRDDPSVRGWLILTTPGEIKMTLEQQLQAAYLIRDFREREIEVARIEREMNSITITSVVETKKSRVETTTTTTDKTRCRKA